MMPLENGFHNNPLQDGTTKLTLNWQKLAERILEQLTNILHPLSGSLDQRRPCHVGVTDPANNDQA